MVNWWLYSIGAATFLEGGRSVAHDKVTTFAGVYKEGCICVFSILQLIYISSFR